MLRSEKTEVVQAIKDRFTRMTSAVFVDFKGMTVEEITRLRNDFKKKGVEYKVVKNTLIRRALGEQPWLSRLDSALKGMTGVAWSYEEPSAAARVIRDFVKDNEKLKAKAGLLEGLVLEGKAVETDLAGMPGKDEARAMLLATLNAPAQRLLMVLNAAPQTFLRVLSAKEGKG